MAPVIGAFLFIFGIKYHDLHSFINYNGEILPAEEKLIDGYNRGFRYGDGLFETIKVSASNILLAAYHFERLFSSMRILHFDVPDFFTPENLSAQILSLCEKNNMQDAARVRLVVFRGNGGLFDAKNNYPEFIIQTEKLENNKFVENKHGLKTDIFADGVKTCDKFCNLKSNNFLIYAMAAMHAKQHALDDCFILNTQGRICESIMANIFIVKNKVIYTPSLSEGCIAGVMRRFVIETFGKEDFLLKETSLSIETIKQADEIFLTNSIFGMRWVKQFGQIQYAHSFTQAIFDSIFKTA